MKKLDQNERDLKAIDTNTGIASVFLLVALAFLLSRGILPAWLIRIPEALVPPLAVWLDLIFNFIKDDLHLIDLTRAISGGLEVLLDITANLLYGRNRWPKLGPIPWAAVCASFVVLAYYLGGLRLALLALVTFVWTALIGQWKIAMQTMSVLTLAAPFAVLIGLGLGITAWKFRTFDKSIRPILSVLQTLPFFTYLLPAVIFFKVGPTAGAVATIMFAVPPMLSLIHISEPTRR